MPRREDLVSCLSTIPCTRRFWASPLRRAWSRSDNDVRKESHEKPDAITAEDVFSRPPDPSNRCARNRANHGSDVRQPCRLSSSERPVRHPSDHNSEADCADQIYRHCSSSLSYKNLDKAHPEPSHLLSFSFRVKRSTLHS
jgi:hypothetical protein